MFFVVDVETSGLTPWTGQILSVAIVPVTEDGLVLDTHFYERIMHSSKDPRDIPESMRTDTNRFWAEQDPEILDEAFNYYPRVHPVDARQHIIDWVQSVEADKSQRFIAANPVAFDKMWLESLYRQTYDEKWPFHYRCLCLRSMRFGLELDTVEYGSAKGAQKPVRPHHALDDAYSEAADLSFLIKMKRTMHVDLIENPSQ